MGPVEGLPRTLDATSSMDNVQQPLPSTPSPRPSRWFCEWRRRYLTWRKIGRSVIEAGDGDNGRVVLVCEVAQDVVCRRRRVRDSNDETASSLCMANKPSTTTIGERVMANSSGSRSNCRSS